ncbi:MAG: DsrE family protein [Candidatus Lokiarchaeota archaeon]|nr:DsrE family protein [Candidatus Harpocratesius repetitus]
MVSDADPRILTDVVFPYARNAIREHWMEEVVLILWGPIQRTVVSVLELKAEVMDLVETEKISVWACKQCSDDYKVSERLIELGVSVQFVGEKISSMLKEGWHQLTF